MRNGPKNVQMLIRCSKEKGGKNNGQWISFPRHFHFQAFSRNLGHNWTLNSESKVLVKEKGHLSHRWFCHVSILTQSISLIFPKVRATHWFVNVILFRNKGLWFVWIMTNSIKKGLQWSNRPPDGRYFFISSTIFLFSS